MAHRKIKKFGNKINTGAQLVFVGGLTGLVTGVVITFYSILASEAEAFARGYFGFFRENPAFIPLLFVALFAAAIIVGGMIKFLPMIRGSGIPQTEGATRGLFHFKWYRVLTGMFAASLFTIFMGLAGDGEGPSILMGGACGYGVSNLLRRNETVRRYQVTGGACAGLAASSNAPLTGMAFAFEEAHKRFTPEVFICSFSSVVVAVIVRNLLRGAMGYSVGALFTSFSLSVAPDLSFYPYVLFCAFLCALCAVGFYFLVLWAKKRFERFTFWKGLGRVLVPFLLAGVFGLVGVSAMGGGHFFIESLGSLSENFEGVFSLPVWASLIFIVLMRFIAAVCNMGAGAPCGTFVPLLALGAGIGALLSPLCELMGMPAEYTDVLILICMSVFFTTVVKAPITGIVMVVELTWNFTFLLPVIMGAATGYLVGEVFRTEPIYDKLLDDMLKEKRENEKVLRITARFRVLRESPSDGRAVRNVLWPSDALLTKVARGEDTIVPDGSTVLAEGDILTVTGETVEREEYLKILKHTVGELVAIDSESVPEAKENKG